MNRKKSSLVIAAAALILVAGVFVSLCVGAAGLGMEDVGKAIFEHGSVAGRILWYARVPRVFAAVLAGTGLSVSGMLIQTVLSNPLAAPSVIGVN
ncbi:MAG: iron ABC transporter permease, partial [Clostridiales Family XIII bacterium]|nr:iron ABC transporter permease [Clostridiales Family XIII bacterium]